MSRNVTLYNFSKRVNSTKRPSGGTTFPCLIKHDTDFITSPFFQIESANPLNGYNYLYFEGSYYYITSCIAHRNNIWEIQAERDALATYKPEIQATNALLLYSTNGDSAGDTHFIPDERIPISREPAIYSEYTSLAGSLFQFSGAGSYLLSVVGESNGVKTYVVSRAQMAVLINGLSATLGQRIWDAIPDSPMIMDQAHMLYYLICAGREVWKSEASYGNYASLIRSCYWIPFSFPGNEGSDETIYIGDYNTHAIGRQYASNVLTANLSLNIPWPVNDWRRNNCILQLYIPLCGKVVLPIDKVINAASLQINISLDIVSGSLSYQVIASNGYTNTITGAQASASYAIGSNNVSLSNALSGVSSIIGGGINAAAGMGMPNPMMAIGGITAMTEGAARIITPEPQIVGNVTGISGVGLQSTIDLELLYYPPMDRNSFDNLYGHPRMVVTGAPNNGFYHFKGFSVDCKGTKAEKEYINQVCNSGIFIE